MGFHDAKGPVESQDILLSLVWTVIVLLGENIIHRFVRYFLNLIQYKFRSDEPNLTIASNIHTKKV